jgi:hypothetical protein
MTCPRCQYQWCWLCGDEFHYLHFEVCAARLARTNNPPWFVLLGLLFGPVLLLLFFLPLLVFAAISRMRRDRNTCMRKFLRKKLISYPIIFISAMLLSPLAVVMVLLISGPFLILKIRYQNSSVGSKPLWLWGPMCVTCGLCVSPVLTAVLLSGLVVAQWFSVGLMVFKVCCAWKTNSYANY